MPETIVVTGGAGFIGSHVVDRLVEGGYAVEIVDNMSTGREINVNPRARLHKMDIRSAELAGLMQELKPAAAVHLAAQIDVRRSLREPGVDADINLLGGINVVKSLLSAGCGYLAFASSAAVYGTPDRIPVPEDAPFKPASPYGISKMAFEYYLDVFRKVDGLKSVSLRFANVYGPRQTVKGEAGVVAIFLKKLFNGQPPTVNGDGEQTRDYVYVGDVADMVAEAVKNRMEGIFNVSTGHETSVNDLTAEILDISGSELKPEHVEAVPNEDRRVALSPEKAKESAEWEPKVAVREGLEKTYEHAKQDPDFMAG